MIILTPVSEIKTISILPRITDFLFISTVQERVENNGGTFESGSCITDLLDTVNEIEVVITKDGENLSETISDVTADLNQNYIELTFPITLLEEGFGYTIECSVNGSLMYRDKIFATVQTDFSTKNTQVVNAYEQYNKTVTNEYIVID